MSLTINKNPDGSVTVRCDGTSVIVRATRQPLVEAAPPERARETPPPGSRPKKSSIPVIPTPTSGGNTALAPWMGLDVVVVKGQGRIAPPAIRRIPDYSGVKIFTIEDTGEIFQHIDDCSRASIGGKDTCGFVINTMKPIDLQRISSALEPGSLDAIHLTFGPDLEI